MCLEYLDDSWKITWKLNYMSLSETDAARQGKQSTNMRVGVQKKSE